MTVEPDPAGWLAPLEPPPGGLDGLRRRIARRERRVALRRAAYTLAGLATAAALLAVALRPTALPASLLPGSASSLLAIEYGLAEAPTEAVTVPPHRRNDTAVQAVVTRDERVVLYLVGQR